MRYRDAIYASFFQKLHPSEQKKDISAANAANASALQW